MATAKQKRLSFYNDILTYNKSLFRAGRSISRRDFVKLFNISNIVHNGTYEEIQRANLALVAAQQEINMLMRENGLYMKSENYYGSFKVVEKDNTKNTILRYSGGVDVFNGCTSRLEVKMKERVNANTWGRYNRVSQSVIAQMPLYQESTRHKRARIRVSQI
jgi:hypothetical protein